MANVYVRSGAGGAGTGADWANAYTTLAAAFAAKAAGDIFWVADDHAESTAGAVALTSPGTISNPCFVYCVSDAGSVPPVAADLVTTGSVATTGANSITFQGYAYCYGLTFSAASGSSNASIIFGASANMRWELEACKFVLNTTGTSSNINIGSTGGANFDVKWKNVTVKFGHVSQSILMTGGRLRWQDTATAIDATGSIPTTLFGGGQQRAVICDLEGVDLVQVATGKTVFAATAQLIRAYMKDCKLGSGFTIAATPTGAGSRILVSRCSDSAGNHIEQVYAYEGTQTDETTIVRTGGASDGTTAKSRKIVTTANAKQSLPFESNPIAIWNDTTGSAITVTMHGIWGGAGVPNNDEVWMEVEYLGSASTPQGSFATAGKATPLATATALSADTSTWGGSTTDFKMSCNFTPQQKGYIFVYPRVGKASDTVYLDPKLVIS